MATTIANAMALWPNTAFNELLAAAGDSRAEPVRPSLWPPYQGPRGLLPSAAWTSYNISDKDAIFLRYVYDHANRTAPANQLPYCKPEVDSFSVAITSSAFNGAALSHRNI